MHRLAQTIRDATPGSPFALAALRDAGVTHVFVGARGGYLRPAELAALPGFEVIYHQDGAWVFRLHYD